MYQIICVCVCVWVSFISIQPRKVSLKSHISIIWIYS
jgi:hypothetical protein